MNVHGALNHRVWRVGVHHVEDRMNYLIALDPQERRSKDLLRFGVHQNFHESVRLAFFPRTADLRHRTLSNQSFPSGLSHFRLSHSCSAQRRINVKGVSRDPVAHAALVAVQKISGYNFIIIVCGMSEGASSVAITQRIDAGHIGAKLIVNLDVTALIDFDPGMSQTEVAGVGY